MTFYPVGQLPFEVVSGLRITDLIFRYHCTSYLRLHPDVWFCLELLTLKVQKQEQVSTQLQGGAIPG